jgi:sialate O-acetylesterase
MRKVLLFASLYMCVAQLVHAEVKPNSLFSANMVLQQGVGVPVWGTAKEGELVSVEFNGQSLSTVTKNGKWMLTLKPMKASLAPMTMKIQGENVVMIPNILIGEVWLCSGQSNMAFPLSAVKAIGNSQQLAEVLKDGQNYPMIRQFSIPLIKSTVTPEKIADVNGKWIVCDSIKAKTFSAVAYFFGRELYHTLNVPIGLMNASYGGTAIENWMSKETLESFPESESIFKNYQKALKEFPQKLEDYKKEEAALLEKYVMDSTSAAQLKKELPRKPAAPMSPAERGGPTGLYNTMIYPLLPYAIKGVIWYQGEANASRGIQYRTLLPALINEWRTDWNNKNLPFFFVQIPGWKNHSPELKEAQLLTLQKVKKTAMTVIYDVDDTLDVHPTNKQPVGERLSLAARALVYGEDQLEYMGPIYENMKTEGSRIILSFSHAQKLMIHGDQLKDFYIAGPDKQFVAAKAIIRNNKVEVFSESVQNPVAVRAGWRLCPQLNLYNQAGLPVSPFRTDTY